MTRIDNIILNMHLLIISFQSIMDESEISCRPIPAPRRLYPEVKKSEYENVTVELINKNLNINSENLQKNANNNEKVPNNKVFLLYPTLPEDVDRLSLNSSNTQKSILTETNDLYGPNANENIPIYSTPQPAPRPRKPQNTDIQNYENTAITPPPFPQPSLEPSTGAISKSLRKAPELPPKTYLNFDRDCERRRSNYSISSEFSTTSSIHNPTSPADTKDTNFRRDPLNKSFTSFKSSNSSLADSFESSESSKYKSPSPGYVEKGYQNTENNEDDDIGHRAFVEGESITAIADK